VLVRFFVLAEREVFRADVRLETNARLDPLDALFLVARLAVVLVDRFAAPLEVLVRLLVVDFVA
jgi:hypothetical protein